jgi:DNA-binding transcriptional ArsR family regulator
MTCTLGITCATGATFIAFTSPPVVSPRQGGRRGGRAMVRRFGVSAKPRLEAKAGVEANFLKQNPYAPRCLTTYKRVDRRERGLAGDTDTIRLGQGKRSVEDAISYAVGHRIRIEILAYLNEGPASPEDMRKRLRLSASTIGHHIKELMQDGSIELADVRPVRNALQHVYRAVKIPFYNDEEIEAMTPGERQTLAGLILEAVMAESMASFWAGKLPHDPRVWLSWRWFNVDAQGRADIADEQARSWERVREIEDESNTRRIKSGEETESIIVVSLGFPRCRNADIVDSQAKAD